MAADHSETEIKRLQKAIEGNRVVVIKNAREELFTIVKGHRKLGRVALEEKSLLAFAMHAECTKEVFRAVLEKIPADKLPGLVSPEVSGNTHNLLRQIFCDDWKFELILKKCIEIDEEGKIYQILYHSQEEILEFFSTGFSDYLEMGWGKRNYDEQTLLSYERLFADNVLNVLSFIYRYNRILRYIPSHQEHRNVMHDIMQQLFVNLQHLEECNSIGHSNRLEGLPPCLFVAFLSLKALKKSESDTLDREIFRKVSCYLRNEPDSVLTSKRYGIMWRDAIEKNLLAFIHNLNDRKRLSPGVLAHFEFKSLSRKAQGKLLGYIHEINKEGFYSSLLSGWPCGATEEPPPPAYTEEAQIELVGSRSENPASAAAAEPANTAAEARAEVAEAKNAVLQSELAALKREHQALKASHAAVQARAKAAEAQNATLKRKLVEKGAQLQKLTESYATAEARAEAAEAKSATLKPQLEAQKEQERVAEAQEELAALPDMSDAAAVASTRAKLQSDEDSALGDLKQSAMQMTMLG